MDDLPAVLGRLEAWLTRELPEVLASLRPGAAENGFTTLELLLGQPLPADLRALYTWHDGQSSNPDGPYVAGLFYGLEFLPLDELIRATRFWQDALIRQPELAEETTELGAHPAGSVRPVWASRGWLRFAEDGGRALMVDLDTGPAGTAGQVVSLEYVGGRRSLRFVLALSLGGFLTWLVTQYEGGNFVIEDEGDGDRSLNIRTPATQDFLDALPDLFGG